MKLIGFVLLFLAFDIKAECPASDRLPVRFPTDESKYFCARFYLGPGKDGPFNGCSGCSNLYCLIFPHPIINVKQNNLSQDRGIISVANYILMASESLATKRRLKYTLVT